jgi:lysophospholipase L1-like esterase
MSGGIISGTRLRTATLLVAIALLVVFLAPALARASSYVALGDSYSSGVGTRTYYEDSASCYRSPKAYPVLVASQLGASLSFTACSGAKTGDVIANQLGPLSSSTGYVTISIGGNDAGFSDVITECAFPGWASDCDGAINTARSYISNTLPGQLDNVYSAIRSRAPSATVGVVGYPRLFNGEDCNAGTFFTPDEESKLNATADLLANVESGRAAAAGFAFVDPRGAFTGHAVCDNVEWLNGLSNPVSESYHPNVTGQANGYTPLVYGALG